VNWLEVAQKMAEDAREQLAINRQRLQEIIEKKCDRQNRAAWVALPETKLFCRKFL
jgi:hypothetical protein